MSESRHNEDTPPQGYTYAWFSQSELPLEQFLTRYRPSMVQNDGTKPWIWVEGTTPPSRPSDSGVVDAAISEAKAQLNELTEKVESIKNNDSIPVRSNKKTGVRSKKEVREQAQAETTEKLQEISLRHGYVNGKWLIFAPADKVDLIWKGIATSIVSGPLASTNAYLAKVSTCPQNDAPSHQHVVCVYIPNVYDKVQVTEVMKILLRNHGATLSGVKSDLYTQLGIDSKHPSGLQSTIWKNTALMEDSEIKVLRDEFFAQITSNKPSTAIKGSEVGGTSNKDGVASGVTDATNEAVASVKPKAKLKKKVKDDPFASDDGGQGSSYKEIKGPKPTLSNQPRKALTHRNKPLDVMHAKPKPIEQEDDMVEDEEAIQPQTKRAVKPVSKGQSRKSVSKNSKGKGKGSDGEEETASSGGDSESDFNDDPKFRHKVPPAKRAKPDNSDEDEEGDERVEILDIQPKKRRVSRR